MQPALLPCCEIGPGLGLEIDVRTVYSDPRHTQGPENRAQAHQRLFVVGFRISAVRFLDQGMAHSGAPGISGNWETSNGTRCERSADTAASPSGIPDRIRQHGVKLPLGEFPGRFPGQLLGLPRHSLPRGYHLLHRTGASGQWRWPGLWCRPDPGLCRRRLVTAPQAQTSKLGADRVTAISETARNLLGAPSQGPEFREQYYFFLIPTHGRDLYADCRPQASRCSQSRSRVPLQCLRSQTKSHVSVCARSRTIRQSKRQ